MAVSIVDSPNPINSIDEPIRYKFTISDLGTPGVTRKSIGWRLVDSGGFVTAVSEISPVDTSYEHPLNLRDIIKNDLRTNIPQLFSPLVQDAAGAKEYTLYYGEISLDLNSGITTGFPNVSSSATPIKVVNCTNNNYLDEIDDMTDYKLLTIKPFQNYYTVKSFDWLYVWGACQVRIVKDYYSDGPGYNGVTVVTLNGTAGKVNCIPIGYRHHGGLNGLKKYMVILSLNGKFYYFKFDNMGNPYPDNPSQIIYFDPAGGYTAIDGIVTSYNPSAEKETVNTYKPYDSKTSGGKQLINSKGVTGYTFKRILPQSADEREQMIRFVTAENYFLPLQTPFAEGLVKFTVEENYSLDYENAEYFEMNGYVTHPVLSANGRF